jgi:hypothetical protein
MWSELSERVRSRRWDGYWLLVLFFALVACAPLTHPGTLQAHSGFLPLYNLYDLETHPLSLSWWPVVGRDFDLLRGEGVLPYLVAEAVRWLGAGGTVAVKVSFGLGVLFGALGMFGWARQVLQRKGALLAAVVYSCWPYSLATLYVRGAMAEVLFLGLLPWALWALQRLLAGHRGSGLWLALGVALLLWTQAGLALWAAALLLIYGLAMDRRHRAATSGWLVGGLLVGGTGLWPLAAARGFGGSSVPFAQHFVYPFQLLSAAWGRGVSVPGWQDKFPMQIGLVAAGLAMLAILLLAGRPQPRKDTILSRSVWAGLGLVLGLILLSLTWSAPLWRWPGLSQASRALAWPWQLLGLSGPFLCLLAGSAATQGLRQTNKGEGLPLWAALVALALLASAPYMEPLTTRYEPAAAPLAVLGDNDLLLLDAQLDGVLRPGQMVQLRVHWQPLRPLAKDYTVFVHALDETGQRRGQTDTQPQSGEYPTSRWQVGEIIEDLYGLRVAPDGPEGGYHLSLGLYNWETGDRLPVGDGDRIIIGETS